MADLINSILEFWFGEVNEQGLCAPDHQSLWFKSSASTDQHCREIFGDCVDRAISGELDNWPDTDAGLIALVILLDQFTRNIYRGTAKAFSGDNRALNLARFTIQAGRDKGLPTIYRVFLYMPLEHNENIEVQNECVALFAELATESGEDSVAGFARYAVAHRDVIARFGRFPHRNAILGRESTKAELGYLDTHGGF